MNNDSIARASNRPKPRYDRKFPTCELRGHTADTLKENREVEAGGAIHVFKAGACVECANIYERRLLRKHRDSGQMSVQAFSRCEAVEPQRRAIRALAEKLGISVKQLKKRRILKNYVGIKNDDSSKIVLIKRTEYERSLPK